MEAQKVPRVQIFGINVQKIEEGDIHTIDGLEVDTDANTMAAVL